MARRTALAIAALCGVGLLASLVLLALDWTAIEPFPLGVFDAQTPWLINAAVSGAFGALIAYRRPRNPIGWLLLALSLTDMFDFLAIFGTWRAQLAGIHAGWVGWLAWFGNWQGALGATSLVMLLFFFPDGRLPGPRWRPAVWALVAFGLIYGVGAAISPTPIQPSPLLPALQNPMGIKSLPAWTGTVLPTAVVAPIFGLVIGAVVLRYRRSEGLARRQIRWFALVVATGLAMTVVAFAVSLFNATLGSNLSALFFDLVIGVAVPLTIGLAVLRQGLYDIDIVVSRTLTYGALAVFITGIYLGVAVGIGALAGAGGRLNVPLSIVATGLAAIAFQPVRTRAQRVANRLVYGARATPYELLSEFSARAADAYAADEVLARMARVLAEGTGADRTEVWVLSSGRLRRAAAWPDGPAPEAVALGPGEEPAIEGRDRVVPVRHQRDLLGALAVNKREALTAIEDKLLADLANQAGLLLRNVRLTSDLQARLEELRLSRQRLVEAQDQERRRIERNLHDGAQQNLVALKVKLGLAEHLLGIDPDKARAALTELKTDADEAINTLRELARGIYPPLLAERGLASALEAQARKATVPVEIDSDGVGRYAEAVEAAVYFCVLEALQNVQKYAGASQATVRLRAQDGALQFEVSDDGRGFDPALVQRGAGLVNMSDRIDALGGSLTLSSRPGGGAVVSGTVPAAASVPD
ncbi:MAG TPA: histidine kinase [Candidatus Dormibacteraeota bacterium]